VGFKHARLDIVHADLRYALLADFADCPFVDARLERFAATAGRGMHIVDDRFDLRPAGTDKWVKSGFLDGDNILPLSHLGAPSPLFHD
jgi:hypothetical protein